MPAPWNPVTLSDQQRHACARLLGRIEGQVDLLDRRALGEGVAEMALGYAYDQVHSLLAAHLVEIASTG